MLSVFFIEIDCPQLIKYYVYLTRLKNEKSQKSHAIGEFNIIIAKSQKVSYQARIPYPQPQELANKFSSNKKSYDVFSSRSSVIGHLLDAFKNRRVWFHRHGVVSRNPQ